MIIFIILLTHSLITKFNVKLISQTVYVTTLKGRSNRALWTSTVHQVSHSLAGKSAQ